MGPRARHGDRAFHCLLPAHVREVDRGGGGAQHRRNVHRRARRGIQLPGNQPDDFRHGAHRIDVDPINHGGLGGVLGGENHTRRPACPCQRRHRDRAANRTDAPVQCEFPCDDQLANVQSHPRLLLGGLPFEGFRGSSPGGPDNPLIHKQPDGNGKVIDRTFLSHVRRGKVDEDPAKPKRVPGVRERRPDSLERFLHGNVGKPDDDGFLKHRRIVMVHLDLAWEGVDALQKI